MIARPISIFLLIVGLLWGLFVLGLFALFGGFFGNAPPHNPILIVKGLLTAWPMFIGPLLTVVGSILILRDASPRIGALTTLAGCVVLNIAVGNDVIQTLHNLANPLIGKQPYTFDVVMVAVALLTDVAAVKVYRSSFVPLRKP